MLNIFSHQRDFNLSGSLAQIILGICMSTESNGHTDCKIMTFHTALFDVRNDNKCAQHLFYSRIKLQFVNDAKTKYCFMLNCCR